MSDGDRSVNHPARRRGPQTATNHAELKRRRVLAGLTLAELGAKAGCTRSHLSDIENENGNASQPLLSRLADALGCDITDLMANGNGHN